MSTAERYPSSRCPPRGQVDCFAFSATDVVIDLAGWLT
jgi:hypothetical protein